MKGETLVNTVTEVVLLGGSVSFIPQNLKRIYYLVNTLSPSPPVIGAAVRPRGGPAPWDGDVVQGAGVTREPRRGGGGPAQLQLVWHRAVLDWAAALGNTSIQSSLLDSDISSPVHFWCTRCIGARPGASPRQSWMTGWPPRPQWTTGGSPLEVARLTRSSAAAPGCSMSSERRSARWRTGCYSQTCRIKVSPAIARRILVILHLALMIMWWPPFSPQITGGRGPWVIN